MTTPTVTEIRRNGNPVGDRVERGIRAPVAGPASSDRAEAATFHSFRPQRQSYLNGGE
jgi:hypothetical protein